MALTTFNSFSRIYYMNGIYWREVRQWTSLSHGTANFHTISGSVSQSRAVPEVVPNISVRLTSNSNFRNFWHNYGTHDAKPYFVNLVSTVAIASQRVLQWLLCYRSWQIFQQLDHSSITVVMAGEGGLVHVGVNKKYMKNIIIYIEVLYIHRIWILLRI